VLRLGTRTGIVMELIDGSDLADWRKSPRTWREIVSVYVQAARGLAAAHRAGLVHRDFKPSNALIDADGVVRVTDFGLVRATDDGVSLPSGDRDATVGELTRTGTVLGTPAYMAPEQHAGDEVDARGDQWALACSLYTALYNQRPFAGDTVNELAVSVRTGVIRAEPTDTRVPRRIRAAVRRALSRSPDDRFATMDELIAAMAPRRRPWIAGAVAVAAIAVSVLAVSRSDHEATCDDLDAPMTAVWTPARAAVLRTQFATSSLDTGSVTASRVAAGLDSYSSQWVASRVRACTASRQGAASAELLDRRMGCLDQRLAEVDSLVAALVVGNTDTIQHAVSATADLHPIADCDDPRDTLPRPTDPAVRADLDRGEQAVARAWVLAELGLFEQARPLSQAAVDIAERAGWSPLVARAQIQLGLSLSHVHDGKAAIAAFNRAASAAASAHDDGRVAQALIAKAYDVAVTLGKPDDALAMKPYVELALERAGQPPRLHANWLHHFALALVSKGKDDEAFGVEMASQDILRTVVAHDNPSMLDSLTTIANIESRRGNLAHAADLYKDVLAVDMEIRGARDPSVAEDYVNIGDLEGRRGHVAEALEYFERAEAIQRKAGIVEWQANVNIGIARGELGRWHAAIEPLERAAQTADNSAPGNTVPAAYTTLSLGAVLIECGELDRAKPLLDRALAAATETGSGVVIEVLGRLAHYWLVVGNFEEARKAIHSATTAHGSPSALIDLANAELAQHAGDWSAARVSYDRALAMATHDGSQELTTAATVGIAECELATGKAADAAHRLDERLAWYDGSAAEPGANARAKLAMARALVASGGDRARAKTLAEAARDGYSSLGASRTAQTADASRWIAATFKN